MLSYELIELTSFWSIWYWIVVVVAWSMTAHWTMGVPYDAVINADRHGGVFAEQCETMAYINAQRIVYYFDKHGALIIGVVTFFLSSIGTAGFYFDIEFFQALFVLLTPLALPAIFSVRLAFYLKNRQPVGEELRKILYRRRLWNQVIGMFAIIAATIAGVVHSLAAGLIFQS
ncbi:MAG: component of SufBCD complex [Rhodobacteraceae bacterium]|nr:component of SufBCD complex [Paracoccaceae bacterium]